MIYLVSYDVQNDKMRTQIMKYLKDRGYHLQKSVFVCSCQKPEQAQAIFDNVCRMMNPKTDRVFMAPMCNSCINKRQFVGNPLDFADSIWVV